MPPTIATMPDCKNQRCGPHPPMARADLGGLPGPAARVKIQSAAATCRLSTGETLAEASESRVLVLVFLRHFGCTFTRQLLRGLQEIQQLAKSHGAELVLVHMMPSGAELPYLTGRGEVTRIADPLRELYRAFGLAQGGVRELLGPRVWWHGLLSIVKGCGVGHLAGDGRQMPGVFLYHHDRVLAAQRARSASDLPDLPRLFDSLARDEPAAPRDV